MTNPGNILIVDDDLAFVEIYVEILEGDGYRVKTANRAEDALRELEHAGADFDVVLLDQKLKGPGGPDTGLDLIQRISAFARFAKIIVVTGYASPEAIERALGLGVYDYLVKNGAFSALLRAKVRNAAEITSEQRRAVLDRDATVRVLRETWEQARTETDVHRKGRLLEELIKLLFRATPGFDRVRTRLENEIEEIDLVVENRSDDPLWRQEGSPYLLGECKNWSRPCGRPEFDAFYMKVKRRHQRARTGFFIAPGGFTEPFHQARAKQSEDAILVIPIDGDALVRWIEADDKVAVLRELHRAAVFDLSS